MSFHHIIGQEKAINYLLASIKRGAMASSYLFSGKEGVGKKMAAIELAKALNCKAIRDNLISCDNCIACKKIEQGIYPDLKIIEPEKENIKIEQVREFRKDIFVKPFESMKKIYIINHAERLTVDAANCLLKTIEEPPEYAIIILICSNINSILTTIISRCQILYFNEVSSIKIEEALGEKYDMEIDKARLMSKFAQGSIGKAFKMAVDDDFFSRRESLIKNLAEIIPGKIDCNMFSRKEKFFTDHSIASETLDMLLLWYRDVLMMKALDSEKYIVNDDKLKILKEKANLYSKKKVIEILNYLLKIQEYLKRNANKNIIFESLAIKLSGVNY